MPNITQWPQCISETQEIEAVEADLKGLICTKRFLELAGLRIPLQKLVSETHLSEAPTFEWYKLHLGIRDGDKWNKEYLAWGLNIFRVDLYNLQNGLTSYIMEARRNAKKQNKSIRLSELPLEDMTGMFRQAYKDMGPKFFDTMVPSCWYLAAEKVFINICKSDAEQMLACGFYDKDTSQLTCSGVRNWDTLREKSISTEDFIWSSFVERQVVVIRARSWPRKPNREFHPDELPIQQLQTLEQVRFDFDGVDYNDRQVVHPVMNQIADIWKKKNALKSLTLPIDPDFRRLVRTEPQLKRGPCMKETYTPLLGVPGIKLNYTYDFEAPTLVLNLNVLFRVIQPRHYNEKAMELILGRSKDFINRKHWKGMVALHWAVCCNNRQAVTWLLSVESLDVNIQDDLGKTPFDYACRDQRIEIAMALARHKKLEVTKTTIGNAIASMNKGPLIDELYQRYGEILSSARY